MLERGISEVSRRRGLTPVTYEPQSPTESPVPRIRPATARRSSTLSSATPTTTVEKPASRKRRRPAPRRELPWPLNLYQSAVGKKWVMALTGLALLGFVLVHMLGNLHLYEGPWETHEYAETLRDLGTEVIPRTWVLWALRFGLIAAFALHIHSAYSLTRMSRAADRRYAGSRDYIAANYASRTMRWTGPLVGLFVVYHLADLTWGHFNPDYIRGDPYHNVVASLSNLPVAIWYIVANVALAVHIYHGAWSMFQSLGINSPRWNPLRRRFAQAFAALILVGNLSFPILVQAGVIDDGGRSVFRERLEQPDHAGAES